MNEHEAHLLLSEWAADELGEIRRAVWYREEAAGFNLLSTDRPVSADSQSRIEHTGWVVMTLPREYRVTIRKVYQDGERVLPRDRRDAVEAFGRKYDEWAAFHEPTNPC